MSIVIVFSLVISRLRVRSNKLKLIDTFLYAIPLVNKANY